MFIFLRLPAWASRVFYTKKFEYCLTYWMFKVMERTPEMAKLNICFLIAQILNFFKSVINGSNGQQVFRLYSVHDYNMARIFSAFGFNGIVILLFLIGIIR